MINGVTPTVVGNTNWAQESHMGAPALNNGVFTGRATVGTTGGRDIIWNFATPQDLASIHLFSSWVDSGRDNVPVVQSIPAALPTCLPMVHLASSGTPSTISGTPLTATLSGDAALQNLALPVTFRLLHPAIGEYDFAGIGRYTGDDIVLTGSAAASKLDQTITFGALAGKTFGDAPFALNATASSGLTVSYESSNTAVATISGETVTIIGEGSSTITASQPGNANYNAAPSVVQTLTVAAPATGLANFRTNSGLAADGSQDLLTPAGDGVENLLKYAFNMIGSGAGQGATLATPNSAVLAPNGFAGLPFAAVDGSGQTRSHLHPPQGRVELRHQLCRRVQRRAGKLGRQWLRHRKRRLHRRDFRARHRDRLRQPGQPLRPGEGHRAVKSFHVS